MKPIHLVPGQKYTIYAVSAGALTLHNEITVTTVLPQEEIQTRRNSVRLGTFKLGRKRTPYNLDIDPGKTLILRGWGHLKADHEAFDSFAVSATINIAGTPEEIRKMVEENLNENFTGHDIIMSYTSAGVDNGEQVYPDSETEHAAILAKRQAA